MTRINVIPVEDLVDEHLRGEYKEITRVFTHVRKAQQKGITPVNFKKQYKQPKHYVMGTGHVVFFYDKLGWVLNRYRALSREMVWRGFNAIPVQSKKLTEGLDIRWFGDYDITQDAINVNIQRIQERLNAKSRPA
jgi:deoxyribonuclease (pyrimidine dimer)